MCLPSLLTPLFPKCQSLGDPRKMPFSGKEGGKYGARNLPSVEGSGLNERMRLYASPFTREDERNRVRLSLRFWPAICLNHGPMNIRDA